MHVGYSYFSKTESPTLSRADSASGRRRPIEDRDGEHRRALAQRERLAHAPGLDDPVVGGDRARGARRPVVLQHQAGLSSKPSPWWKRLLTTRCRSAGVQQIEQSDTAVAFTAGLDGTYRLTPKFGIGAFFRYSGASSDMPLSGGGTRHGRGGWHSDWRGPARPVLGHCRQASSLQLRLGRHARVSPNVEDDNDEEGRSFITVTGRAWPSRPWPRRPARRPRSSCDPAIASPLT